MSMGNVGNGDVETLLATSLSWAETSEPRGSKAARIMTNPRQISIHFEGLFRGSVLGGLAALARSRRNYAVFPLLLIDVFHLQQHLVLVNAELSLLAHRQQYWMLFVPWANTVNHAITLQQIFLTQQSVSLLVSRVRYRRVRRQRSYRCFRPHHTPPSPFAAGCHSDGLLALWPGQKTHIELQ